MEDNSARAHELMRGEALSPLIPFANVSELYIFFKLDQPFSIEF